MCNRLHFLLLVLFQSLIFQSHGHDFRRQLLIDVYDGLVKLEDDSIKSLAESLLQSSDDQYTLALSNFHLGFIKNLDHDLNGVAHYITAIHQLEDADTLDVFLDMALRKNIGAIYKQYGDLESGIRYYLEAIPFAEAYDKTRPFNEQTNVMSLKYNLANAYSMNYNPKAVDIYLEVLEEAKKKGVVKKIAQINNQLGMLFQEAKEYGLAINHYKNILGMSDQLTDPKLKVYLGFANQNIGEVYIEQGNYQLAEQHLLESLVHFEETRRFGPLVALVELYINNGDKDLAKRYGDQALAIYPSVQKTNDRLKIFELMSSLITTEENQPNVYVTQLLTEQRSLSEEKSQLADLKDKENLYRVVDSYYKELEANQRKSEYRQWIITGCAILVALIALVAVYFMIMDKRRSKGLSELSEDSSSDFKYY